MFCINIMAGHHEEVTRRFSLKGVDRFAGIAHDPGPCGPILKDAVGWIDCAIREEHDAGDHMIVVASVSRIEAAADTAPLVFFRGYYGTFRAAASSRLWRRTISQGGRAGGERRGLDSSG